MIEGLNRAAEGRLRDAATPMAFLLSRDSFQAEGGGSCSL